MGIFIYLGISKSVTPEEWKKVYEESLVLVDNLPLAEGREMLINDIKVNCLTHSKERSRYIKYYDKNITGWWADGDYDVMKTAEEYGLKRKFISSDDIVEKDGYDPIIACFPQCLNDWSYKDYEDKIYNIWGMKTQGEPYHIYLLAIACLLEHRLPGKIYVYGDITKGQCTKAVRIANKYLKNPIELPSMCDLKKLFDRINTFDLCERDKISVFGEAFLGNKDKNYGEFIRCNYSADALNEYWKNKFSYYGVETAGFKSKLQEYLLWGFELNKLCECIDFDSSNNKEHCKNFVHAVLDTKIYKKEKECYDHLKIDKEEEGTYSIFTLLAQFAFGAARNYKVDRYVPIKEIKACLISGIGDKCDVSAIIDKYLQEDEEVDVNKLLDENGEISENEYKKDPSVFFNKMMDKKIDVMKENREKYDISEYLELLFYEKDDTIEPSLFECIKRSFDFCCSCTEEEQYKELMKSTGRKRCEYLVDNNRSLWLRDTDWQKIFDEIMNKKETFARYYPMVRVKINSESLVNLMRAFIINDDLYNMLLNITKKE